MPTDRYVEHVIPTREKTYLGDAVYAGIDEIDRLVLTTEDGIGVTNQIVCEPEVVQRLHWYVRQRIETP